MPERSSGSISLTYWLYTAVVLLVSCVFSYLLSDAKRMAIGRLYQSDYLLEAQMASARTWELWRDGFIF